MKIMYIDYVDFVDFVNYVDYVDFVNYVDCVDLGYYEQCVPKLLLRRDNSNPILTGSCASNNIYFNAVYMELYVRGTLSLRINRYTALH